MAVKGCSTTIPPILHLLLMRQFSIFFCFALLTACEFSSPPASNVAEGRIQPWQQDSTYWSWDGKTPVLLLGSGLPENSFLGRGWATQLRILSQSGGNYIYLTLTSEDLEKESYLDSLTAFIKGADQERIAVALQIDHNEGSTKDWSAHFEKFPNVIPSKYRTFWPKEQGAANWPELLAYKEDANTQAIPLIIPEVLDHGEIAAEGIAGFNRSVLAGAAAVRHASLPKGEGFTSPALTSIRAVRTVENLLKFWDLRPAPEIIPGAAPNSVYAATDDENGYLLYLPTAGSVELQLDIKPQLPLRVTVIGYLGSQKSEILRPPYGDSFTLFTEEPRGGWMVIKPL